MRLNSSVRLLACALALSISPAAHAGTTCAPSDLTVAPDSPMRKMPYANQGTTPTCYLHTGEFLVDWYRASHGDGSGSTSLLFLGHHAHKDIAGQANSDMKPIQVYQVVDAARKFGVCDSRVVEAAIMEGMSGQNRSLNPEIKLLEIMSDATELMAKEDDSQPYTHSVFLSHCEKWDSEMFNHRWLAEHLETKLRAGLYDEIFKDVLKSCEGLTHAVTLPHETFISPPINALPVEVSRRLGLKERLLSGPPWRSTSSTIVMTNPDPQESVDAIIASLTAVNPQPVGASYCADILGDSSYRLVGANSYATACGAHASALVGSRMRNGRCELLLHNSWGNDYGHSPDWQEQRDSSGGLTGLWIDAEAFVQSSYLLEHL